MPQNNLRVDKWGASAIVQEAPNKFKLLPHATLKNSKCFYNVIEEGALLQNQFTPGINIFYLIKVFDGAKEILSETGIGEISKVGRNYFFVRESVFIRRDEYCNEQAVYGLDNYEFPTDKFIVIQSYTPKTLTELFSYRNAAVCSNAQYSATCVELQNNTLLGCYNDEIQSIDREELLSILDVNTIEFDQVRLKPTKRTKGAKRGTIIFNQDTNSFEGYNGTEWVQL